jgi:hypothetical protein
MFPLIEELYDQFGGLGDACHRQRQAPLLLDQSTLHYESPIVSHAAPHSTCC